MAISKRATKLMAFVLTFAFLMTGPAYVPKQVQAAEAGEKPGVEVLGATLRLDGVSGTQSLRFGIKISKASLAKDCGIVLTANGRKVKVGTDVEEGAGQKQHKEMYIIDTTKDEVVYCAVVTGIPYGKYDTKFEIEGYAVAVDTEGGTVESPKEENGGNVKKSVEDVVEALDELDPDIIKIDETTGDLVRIKADGAVQKVTGTDIIFNGVDVPVTDKTFIPVKLDTAVSADGKMRYDAEKKVVVIDDAAGSTNNSSVDFDLPSKVAPLEEVEITVKGKYTGTSGFRMWLGSGHDKSFQDNIRTFGADELKENEEFTVTVTASNECGRHNNLGSGGTTPATKLSVKAPRGQNLIDGLTIESITINYVDRTPDIAVDLSKESSYTASSTAGAVDVLPYDGKDLKVSFPEGGHADIVFKNPADSNVIGNYKYVTITYTSEKSDGLQAYIADGTASPDRGMGRISAFEDVTSVTFKAEKSMNGFKIYNGAKGDNISIKSVVFSHKKPEKAVKPADPSVTYYILDLNDESSYTLDGGDTKIMYNESTGKFDVTVANFQGIIFNNTAEDVEEYKYATLIYSDVDKPIRSYIFDGEMGNSGKGQTPGGAVQKPDLSDKDEQIVTYTAEKSMYGLKFARVDSSAWQGTSMAIKAIIFSKNELTDDELTEITGGGSSPAVTEFDTPVGFMDDNVSAAGTVEDIVYGSTAIKAGEVIERKAKVVLPKGYSADKEYPVVYMLHGIGENETTLCERKAQNIFWNAAATGAAKDMIAVFPNVCANETGRPPLDENGDEKFFHLDHYAAYDNFVNDLEQCLMPYINAHYSTLTDRENTAICGFSMGGREALYIGLTRAKQFGYVGGFCPAYGLLAYSNWTGVSEEGMFASRADIKPADGYADNTLILIVKGKNDYTVGDQPYLYHNVLEENNISHFYYETLGGDPENVGDGGHGEVVYEHGLYNFITRMSKSE